MAEKKREHAPRAPRKYTLVIGGRAYRQGGFGSLSGIYDALQAYAVLVPATHRVPFHIVCGDYVPGTDFFV